METAKFRVESCKGLLLTDSSTKSLAFMWEEGFCSQPGTSERHGDPAHRNVSDHTGLKECSWALPCPCSNPTSLFK